MKVRFTAFNISSMDMKTVITLRRKRNPATPRVNSTALSRRYQERGTPCMSVELLARQHDSPENGDQDQHGSDFERQQILGEEGAPDVLGRASLEAAEEHRGSVGEESLNKIGQQAEHRDEQ